MSPLRSLRLLAALACMVSAGLRAQSVLFVGNSFTFMPRTAGIGVVDNLNKGPATGVPAVFQALAAAGGKTPAVSMEAVGGKNLEFHYTKRRELIDKPWDIVVLQDYSTGPLIENGKRTSYDSFRSNLKNLRDLLTAQNPAVKIWLYETWARPDYVKKGRFGASMGAMQADLHRTFSEAAKDFALQGWVPVGDAFRSAVQQGLADDPVTPASEGPLKIWWTDNHHQSPLGTYLAALLFYGEIYQADPRALPADNAAAQHLKISADDSRRLQALAWEQLQPGH